MYQSKLRLFLSAIALFWVAGCSAIWPDAPDTQAMAQEALTAKVTLAEAVSVAVQHANGIAAEVHFKTINGTAVYEVKVITPRETNFVSVDASTGIVVHQNRKWAQVRWLKQQDQAERRALVKKSAVTLDRAVKTAEQQSGGRAFEVNVNSRKYPQYYIVKIAKDNSFSVVHVNID